MKQNRYLIPLIVVAIIAACGFLALQCLPWQRWFLTGNNVHLRPTAAQIMSVMPRGELYVATAVIEDYASEQATEYHLGLFPEHHSCALIMQQKVSYVVNVDDITYELQPDGTVAVYMPSPHYTASTQSVRFISDDEAFWHEQMPSTSDMKSRVADQIRMRFDTPDHRSQARIYAHEAISHILQQMGYDADFRTLDSDTAGR